MTQSFGFLLRQYRNKSIDPQNGRRLSQEALGRLIGKELGTQYGYSAQAISDWERDRSQIHKDHRQVLLAIVQSLQNCGGLTSPGEAEALLAAGNYRSLTRSEVEIIFKKERPSSTPVASDASAPSFPKKLADLHKTLTPISVLNVAMIVLVWVATWLSIAPVLIFSDPDSGQRLRCTIMLAVSGLFIPAILTWTRSLQINQTQPPSTYFKAYLTSLLGFSLGLSNILALAVLSYNLALYPWPKLVSLVFSLWPIALTLVLSNPAQPSAKPNPIIGFRWVLLALPITLSVSLYSLHPLLSDRLLGPFLAISLSLTLGLLLWSQTRK